MPSLGLTPHGVSGLKYTCTIERVVKYKSHPTRGEWIEITLIDTLTPPISTGLTPHGVSGLK